LAPVSRRIGWVQLATGAAGIVYGVWVLAAGWGGNRFFGAYAVLDAGFLVPAGVYSALIIPQRRRHGAQNYQAVAGPESPGSPSASAGRPDKHGGNLQPG
jgi:hypothetical protein